MQGVQVQVTAADCWQAHGQARHQQAPTAETQILQTLTSESLHNVQRAIVTSCGPARLSLDLPDAGQGCHGQGRHVLAPIACP